MVNGCKKRKSNLDGRGGIDKSQDGGHKGQLQAPGYGS